MAKRARARGEPIPEPLTELSEEESTVLREIYETIGGRTSFLARVARADDMLGGLLAELWSADAQRKPSTWCSLKRLGCFQSESNFSLVNADGRIGLIPEMDDDVM